jgi:SAM-dependent methyltransferase
LHFSGDMREAFLARARELGLSDLDKYRWYHCVDVGDGLVTPGHYDYRETIDCFGFDRDLTGTTALDIGSATGFFAFELERRGARVTSLELPSLDALDRFPGQTIDHVVDYILRMSHAHERTVEDAESLYWNLLEGPFRFCHERLGSAVERAHLSMYDLSLERLGKSEGFDLVFVSDVLWHIVNPLAALAAAASVCRGTLIVAQTMPELPRAVPAMVYEGGTTLNGDGLHWFAPTKECFIEMLLKLGFSQAHEFGKHRGMMNGHPFERTVVHATR